MESKYTQVTKLWADMRYQGKNLKSNINDKYSIDLEVIKKNILGAPRHSY
jgi:hypothetical protein